FKLLSFTDLVDAVSELLSSVSEQGFCMTTESTLNESTFSALIWHYDEFVKWIWIAES
nr:hypothetical protein [Tanacetum cinerariifolium]